MSTTIDSLQIEINASAKNADKAVDNLVAKLNKLTTSLKKVNRTESATKGLRKVASVSKTAKTNIDKTTNSVNKSAKSYNNLASAIGKFYATYFMAIRGLKGLWSSIESTADYIEAYNYFNVSLGKIGKDWSHQFAEYGYDNAEAYAESFSKRLEKSLSGLSGVNLVDFGDGTGLLEERGLKNLGLNIQEVTQYASQLASVTNSIGQTGEVSLATASAFTKLGADISSLFNIDYSTAMNNLQSGLIGQSRALYKYGIDITNATLQTYAYELGLEKAVSEMTQAEKMQLRMLAILDQSKVSWGDLANTINSPSNMIRQFKNNLKETGIVLGQLFIPLLQKALPVINGITIALKRMLVGLANVLGIKLNLDDFGKGTGELADGYEDVADGLDDISSSAKKAKAGLRAFDELKVINTAQSSGSGVGGIGNSIDLTNEILEATQEYEKVWAEAFAQMENRAQEFADRIQEFFKPITDPLAMMFRNLKLGGWSQSGEYFSDAVIAILDMFSNAINSADWEQIGRSVGLFISNIDWVEIIKKGFELKFDIAEAIADAWFSSFSVAPIETSLITALGVMKFTGVGATIATGLGLAITTAIIGQEIGKQIGEALFPEDAEWYENFSWTGEEGFFDTISEDWKTSLDGLINMANDFENNPVIAGLTRTLIGPFAGLGANFVKIKQDISGFKKSLTPIFEDLVGFISEKGLEAGMSFGSAIGEKWEDFREWWGKSALSSWWEQDVKPWFDLETWKTLLSSINTSFETKWGETATKWKSDVQKWWDENVSPWFTLQKWNDLLSNIPEAFKEGFKSAANFAIDMLNNVIDGVEGMINLAIEGLNHLVDQANKVPGISIEHIENVDLPTIPAFRSGGFPEDGLFFANRGELVGQFSNGKTAVANNEQIVSGIEGGVERAVARVLAPYLADIAETNRQVASKNFGITRDEVGRAAQSWAHDYNLRTGDYAYM